jgi:hypothetical protein
MREFNHKDMIEVSVWTRLLCQKVDEDGNDPVTAGSAGALARNSVRKHAQT